MSQGTLTSPPESGTHNSERTVTPNSGAPRNALDQSQPIETTADPESISTHRRRRWLVGFLRRWTRRAFTVGLVLAVAALAQRLSIGAVPAVMLAVVVGAIAMLIARRKRMARWPRISFIIGLLLIGVLASASWSYNGYLDAPGAATAAVRTGDWMRDHHMNPIVDRLEQYLYAGQVLGNGRVAANQIPTAAVAKSIGLPGHAGTPAPVPARDLINHSLKGEGKWSPSGRLVNGHPVAYTTFIRPDRAHTDVVAAAAWFDPAATRVTYVPGTKQPGNWAWKSGVPVAKRRDLVAAFNSGFMFKDVPGGFYSEGRSPRPLVDGQASLVIRSHGPAEIGAWGTEIKMTSDVIAVRQNLALLVDHGRLDPGLHTGVPGKWAKLRWQLQHTNRSGIGITSTNALVYVSGSNLTAETLGIALVKLGSVRAMELDIHATNPTLNFFYPDATGSSVAGSKLTQSMKSSATRYLAPDQRDFFAVTLSRPTST